MPEQFATPQDAEDAFYDAIDERDAEGLRAVWEDSADIACLLPMQPMLHGANVQEAFRPLMDGEVRLDIQVRHIRWLDLGDLAMHYVDEIVSSPGHPAQPPVFATNIYRKGPDGWHLILHQNSPSPPPAGAMPPDMSAVTGDNGGNP